MAVNKQPVFTAIPYLKITNITPNQLNSFDPTSPYGNAVAITNAGATEGTLIERITIQAAMSPSSYATSIDKLLYIIVGNENTSVGSILAVKKWNAFDIGSTFTEPPYWELTFTGGFILDADHRLYFNQIRSNGGTPGEAGDGVTVTVEGSTYTAP